MKRIVVHVFPESSGTATADAGAHGDAPRAIAREPLRVEALLSDTQAQRLLSMLVDQEPRGDARVMIEEMLQKQLDLAGPDAGDLFERIVLNVERQLITQVFDACERVKTRAAARLGIDRNTLHKKLRKYELIEEETD